MVEIRGVIGNGEGEVNLLSVIEQVGSQKGKNIHVMIDSVGGDLDEGVSIYNYLKGLPNVTTECSGSCASAASIVFMAGKKRIAGCPIMIHNPYLEDISGTADDLQYYAEYVKGKELEMEKIYASHSNVDVAALSDLMHKETYISPSQAVTLNFATEAKKIVVARLNPNINKNEVKMSKTKEVKRNGILALFGFGSKASTPPKVLNMELSTADGGTLRVDREEGSPQIGDSAEPNGSHTMPDGSVIVVENGVITEIVEPSAEGDETTGDVTDAAEAIVDLVDELQSEVETLKEELAIAKAQACTQEDLRNRNAIRYAGGYDKVFAKVHSSYAPKSRVENKTKTVSNPLQDRINAAKEKGGR